MEISLIIGLILSLFVGISLGLIGGGGSILTVPILVYVIGIAPELSTAYSLFVVGVTAIIGSYSYYKNNLISIKTAVLFSIPSLIAVFLTRSYIMPNIPEEVFSIAGFVLTKKFLIMALFAVLMIAASFSMIRKGKPQTAEEAAAEQEFNYPLIIIEGLVVGVLTGFVGAGGGFLIIPALVVFAKLPMKKAVGTSLIIIGVKSLIGFGGDLQNGKTLIDWTLLLSVTGMAIIGIFIGSALAKKISGDKLKPAFGWFVLVMGIYILVKESFFS